MFFLLQEVFFSLRKPYRVILGPPKHVLHLVWSVLGISTAIKTALKVALYDCFDGPLPPLNGRFMAKVDHYNRTKQLDFSVGSTVKLVLLIIDSISKKMGCKLFFVKKKRQTRMMWLGGGWGVGGSEGCCPQDTLFT